MRWYLPQELKVLLYSFVLSAFFVINTNAESLSSPFSYIDQYLHFTYTSGDILPADQILDIAQDKTGYLWIATDLGVFRFDGRTFEHFNLMNNPEFTSELFTQIEVSPSGKIWLAGPSGLYYFKDGQFRLWRDQDGDTIDQIKILKVDEDENLWIRKVYQLYLIQDDSLQLFDTPNEIVQNVFVGQNGTTWVPCHGSRLLEIKKSKIVRIHELSDKIDGEISFILERKNGDLTLGVRWHGIAYYYKDGTIEIPTQGSRLPNQNIRGLAYDNTGSLWVAANGIYRFSGNEMEHFSMNDGLTHSRLYALFKDNHENLWVGSKKGLNLFSKSYVKQITRRKNKKPVKINVTAVQVDKSGNIWVGSNGWGMFLYKGNELIVPDNPIQTGEVIYSIQPVGSGVYICSSNGTFEAALENQKIVVKRKLVDEVTYSFYIASDSTYWYDAIVPGRARVVFYEKNGVRTYVEPPVSNIVYWFAEYMEGIITMGTEDGLYNWYDGKIDSFRDRFGLPVDRYFGHCWDTLDNAKWFGAGGTGLVQLEGERVNTFNTKNGLPTNSIRGVFIDDKYNFNLIGYDDVYMIPVKQVSKQYLDSNNLTYTYFKLGGMVNTIGFPNFAVDHSGHILIASNEGLFDLDPGYQKTYDTPVLIKSILVDGQEISFKDPFQVAAKSKRIEIRFTAIDFIEGRNTTFAYRMKGFEDQWKLTSEQPIAEYTNLPAGTFQFELRTLNHDGTVKSEAQPVVFTKEQIWWKTTGAIMMYVLGLGAIIIAIFQLRVRTLKRQREILQIKVNKRTSQLKELNENLEQKVVERTSEIAKMNNVLEESEERYRYALDASNDGIWDWDVKNDTIQFSPAIYTMLGYEPYEFEQSRDALYQCIHTEDKKRWHIASHEKLKLNTLNDQLSDEYKMLSKQGEIVWIQVKGKVVERDDKQLPNRIVGTHIDITAEKLKTQEVLEAILRTEDMERSRISKEIHDGLQQTLTISALNFQALKKGLNNIGENLLEKFDVGWDYLQRSIKESRSVAHTLMPKGIVDFGVISAFQNLIDDMDKASEGTSFTFYHNFEKDGIENKQVEITFYRILQEAINNIIKYAKATQVDVQLKEYGDIFTLTIEDNGIGFDAQKLEEKDSGLGLKSMRNRVEAIDGIIEIDSRIGKGTSILVEINKTI